MKKARRVRSGAKRILISERFSEKMPVGALPPNTTKRYWLDYTVNGDSHSMLMRVLDTVSDVVAKDVFSGLIDLIDASTFYAINPTGMRVAEAGSDVTLPAVYDGSAIGGNGTAFDTDFRAKTYSFTGRDPSGHKTRLFIYGAKASANGDYRIQVGENSIIETIVDYLNALTNCFVSINGRRAIWNQYANTGYNDHWIKKARNG